MGSMNQTVVPSVASAGIGLAQKASGVSERFR